MNYSRSTHFRQEVARMNNYNEKNKIDVIGDGDGRHMRQRLVIGILLKEKP
jgi:hypothetical protein